MFLAVVKWRFELTERRGMSPFFFKGKFHFGTWIGTVCRASRYWILSPETQGLCSVILVHTWPSKRRVQDGPLRYVDMFGYNVGKHWNSVLKRIAWISALFKCAKKVCSKSWSVVILVFFFGFLADAAGDTWSSVPSSPAARTNFTN